MPELPEVETVKNGLAPHLTGATINHVRVRQRALRTPVPKAFENTLKGAKILSLSRRSKYLIFNLSHETSMLMHLGMSGQVTLTSPSTPLKKHDHVIFDVTDGQQLRFNDARRFGLVDLLPTKTLADSRYFKHLGPEPLEDAFSGDALYQALKRRSCAIKLAIMDAKIVVGVGNIYASEALFSARIHPTKPANRLTPKQCKTLAHTIKETLARAIQAGGSTLKDYVQSDGSLGYFQHQFLVYGKNGIPCTVCNTPIEKLVLSNRSTFYCPACQK